MRFRNLLIISLLIVVGCQQQVKEKSPNFIVFIADDVSWNDIGCYGNEIVQTPNIDRIASEGVRFDNAFLTASSCSPSRISIITGRYPHNTGAAELHTEPSVDFSTIPKILKQKGYYTGQAGKWHMGEIIKSGFDTIHEKRSINGDGGEEHWVDCLKERNKEKPFFFWFAGYDAHRIWGPNEFSGTHSSKEIITPHTLVNGDGTKTDLAKYYDEIKRFDHYIGEVEKELKQQGVLDNTVIIILADNGRPFPRDKTRVYDSGMKTPFIIKWSNGIKNQGSICNSLISSIDLAPTLIEIAGIDKPDSFMGYSFKSLLGNADKKIREYVFAEHNWHDHEAHERMVRTERYLYLINSRPQFSNQGPADAIRSESFTELKEVNKKGELNAMQADIFMAPRPPEELFDCINDELQIKNLASNEEYKDIRNDLRGVLSKWIMATGDNIPNNLTSDWYSRITGLKVKEGFGIRGEMPGEANNATEINSDIGHIISR
jgi:arylsulfatase A-like enzyme